MTLFAAKTKRQAEPAEPQTKPRRKLTRAERKQIEGSDCPRQPHRQKGTVRPGQHPL